MAPERPPANRFRLPELRTTVKLAEGGFWDVKFCPYYEDDNARPVFALVSSGNLLIGQINDENEHGLNILLTIKLEVDDKTSHNGGWNSCTWCYVDPARPLVAIAGDDGQVVVIDALTGSIFATLLGHGIGTVNDLATHPLYPWIITSASMDASARIWDLRRVNQPHESTTIIICGHGQAHEEGLLTVGWHRYGRYLVTGGHDQKICVWTLPDLAPDSHFWQTISKPIRKRSADEVHIVHYPHFISSAVHNNYVDKAVFFGDLILSKAAEENKIVLWQITGFNARRPPPGEVTAPKTNEYLDTRNGFIRKPATDKDHHMIHAVQEQYQGRPPYQRLLEFDAPQCKWFYMRFGFLQPSPRHPDVHPTLAMGDVNNDIFFWDFERLIIGHDGGASKTRGDSGNADNVRKIPRPKKGIATRIDRNELLSNTSFGRGLSRPDSPGSSYRSSSVAATSTSLAREQSMETASHTSEVGSSIDGPHADRIRYALDNPHKPLKAHKTVKKGFAWEARATDWSACGRWCIIVGGTKEGGGGVAAVTRRPS